MAKKETKVFTCQSCSYKAPKWLGRCPDCGEWNAFIEEIKIKTHPKSLQHNTQDAKTISDIEIETLKRVKTEIAEFDRVLGGGMAKGSLILVGGEPGIGKSTLLTMTLGNLAHLYRSVNFLYASGEESTSQIAGRMRRLGITEKNLYIYHGNTWQNILMQIQKLDAKVLVLDSIQTTLSSSIDSPPGTISQVREVTYEIMNTAKSLGITCFVVGHITKEGAIAGPKILEHMVDTVVYFEGDQTGYYRLLRAVKNRFGNTNEVGVFEMKESGLKEVKNPSQYFIELHKTESFGRTLSCLAEGSRSLFVETQGLVVENKYGTGRRTTQGIDPNRLSMLVAVIEKYFSIPIGFNDIYLNIVGGIKLNSNDADLSIIAALLSSYYSRPVSSKAIFIGEVGLTGEVRTVPFMEMRVKEIDQLKYHYLITSKKIEEEFGGQTKLKIIGIEDAFELKKIIETLS